MEGPSGWGWPEKPHKHSLFSSCIDGKAQAVVHFFFRRVCLPSCVTSPFFREHKSSFLGSRPPPPQLFRGRRCAAINLFLFTEML